MRWCLLAAAVVPRTGKIIKNGHHQKFATKWYIKLCI